MAKRFTTTIKVRSYEVDLYGHVNNAVYMNYLEQARVEYLEQVGLSFEYFLKRGIYFVVASARLDFKAPAFMGDVLEISGYVKRFGNSSITLIQKIRNPKSDLEILDAEITAVFLDGNNKPVPVPEDFKKAFG